MNKEEETTSAELEKDLDLHEAIILTQDLLTELIEEEEGHDCESIFNSKEIPNIQLDVYLRRIHRYTHFSPQCLLIAILYIDRYNLADKDFSLNWYNVHRMLLTCLTLAVKFHDDIYFDNLAFQKAGGLAATQLFAFEMEIFERLDFNLYVPSQKYEELLQKLYTVYGEPETS